VTLWKRILVEKRLLVIPLALGAILNIVAYVAIVRPLGVKAAGVADRAAAATRSVATAERDYASAQALVTGKTRADEELSTFFDQVLPADQSAARRLTFTAVPALARKRHVKYLDRKIDVELGGRDAQVARLKIRVDLQGDYESLRQFIFELESAPEFVIIDDVTLVQSDPDKPLTLSLELSTYYRLGPSGA
jgi:type II secretion system (T2SS) protein M